MNKKAHSNCQEMKKSLRMKIKLHLSLIIPNVILLNSICLSQHSFVPIKVKGGFIECRVFSNSISMGSFESPNSMGIVERPNQLLEIQKFNNKGYIVEEIFDNYSSRNFAEPQSLEKIAYKYDNNDSLIEIIKCGERDTFLLRRDIVYNKTGKRIEEIHYDSKNEYKQKSLYKYNENGNISKIIINKPFSQIIQDSIIYFYNEKDYNCKIIHYDENNSIYKIDSLTYNLDGKIIEVIENHPMNSFSRMYKNKYDINGNRINSISFENNKTKYEDTYIYEGNNNLIETISYDNEGCISTKDYYKYDIYGNIIENSRSWGDNKPQSTCIFIYSK